MAWAYRASSYADDGAGFNNKTNGQTATVTLGTALSSGDLIVLLAQGAGAGGTQPTFSVSDSVNGSWPSGNEIKTLTQTSGSNGARLSMWIFPNSAAGTPTITVTFSVGVSNYFGGLSCAAFSGIATSSPVDQVVGTTGVSSSPASGSSPATGAANELVVAIYADLGSGDTVNSGNINGSAATLAGRHSNDANFWQSVFEYGDSGSSGSTPSATMTKSTSDNWSVIEAVFKLSGGGAGSNALVSTIHGTSTVTAALSLTKHLSSTIAGIGHLTGGLSLTKHLSCTLAGVGHLTAPLSITKNLACSIAGHGTLASSLSLTKNLSTTLAGHGALIAALTGGGSNALVAVLAGRSTFTSNLTTHLSCSIAGRSTTTAGLSLSKNLSTTISGVGQITAPLSVTKNLSCTIAGHGSQTATLGLVKNLSAALAGRGSLVGAITLAKLLSTTLSGTAAVISTLQGGSISLMAALSGHSAMSAQWSIVPTSTCIDLSALKRITVAMSGETTTAIPVSGISLISVKMTGKVC